MSPDGRDGQSLTSPGGSFPARFTRRWHLVGAGLSNVWKFGDLELAAPSGRLLLRGGNGVGKTTTLEALAPYLLDLNAARMSAGKARTTNLSSLMREGASGRRRYGYAWLTLADSRQAVWSFGVRIQYSDGASPPTRVLPFAVPGRPLHELKLHGIARAALTSEQFIENVTSCGGEVFEAEEAYPLHLAARLFSTADRRQLDNLAQRLRHVRNPAILSDLSPQAAADALRESLPGVDEEVINATAEALAESDATREAFNRDKEAAELLDDFSAVWCAHVADVLNGARLKAGDAMDQLKAQRSKVKSCNAELATATTEAAEAKQHAENLATQLSEVAGEIEALEKHETYKVAGRLGDLKRAAQAERQAAQTAIETLRALARSASLGSASVQRELKNIAEDLDEECALAARADRTAESAPLLSWTLRSRAPLRAGEVTVEAGDTPIIQGDGHALRTAAAAWQKIATAHRERSEAAALALADLRPVERLEETARQKTELARQQSARAEADATHARHAHQVAGESAQTLRGEMRTWTLNHPHLAADGTDSAAWSVEDIDALAYAEPARVLADCDAWARHAMAKAEAIASERRARADQQISEATRLRAEADALRVEATALRAGRLLPLPRPEWAGSGDDTAALGAVVDWKEAFADSTSRALVEAAIAAAGLLGARIDAAGAVTERWRVSATGPVCARNLAELITVDAMHPLASAAAAVLTRVVLEDTATPQREADGAEAALCIGRDGTFRAGVLLGRVPGADDRSALAPATHIGARQRRAAALARAALLEGEASQAEARAAELENVASQLKLDADNVSAQGQSTPSREDLRGKEAQRVEAARVAEGSKQAAASAQTERADAVRAHEEAHAAWLERTRANGLPASKDELRAIDERSGQIATELTNRARVLGEKLAARLDQLIARHSNDDIDQRLSAAEALAQQTHARASSTEASIRTLEETAGAAIEDILARHSHAKERKDELDQQAPQAAQAQIAKAQAQASADTKFKEAQRRLQEEVQPHAAREMAAVRTLLDVPGVAQAVLGQEPASADADLLAQLERELRGVRTLKVKTVLERNDAVRAKLAGIWSLDPGESHGELLTFALTYRDTTYTPIEAAAHARKLSARAEQALAASEERALQEFVIGRLPNAIAKTWTHLHDWISEVNRKMRAAAASSGVGVQVRMPLRDDLPPASREVYELACKTSSAERSSSQQQVLGAALRSLIEAAPGETMHERLASAIDIRDWVEVYYEVTRPGGKTQRWSTRTGLSGGERRLVVLAPMLAAIAANYDRFGEQALRLVTLDEIPAEVDERGREGLARYIAELDLDLICTSYLWDGCPGAWDGIDAYDLEAGADGTVVAFPMLVRGLLPIPDIAGLEVADSSAASDAEAPT